MYDQILVPTDDSEHAARAADHGALLARSFDATLYLLTVVDTTTVATGSEVGVPSFPATLRELVVIARWGGYGTPRLLLSPLTVIRVTMYRYVPTPGSALSGNTL